MLAVRERYVSFILPLKYSENSTNRTIFEFQIHFLYFRFMGNWDDFIYENFGFTSTKFVS